MVLSATCDLWESSDSTEEDIDSLKPLELQETFLSLRWLTKAKNRDLPVRWR